MDNARISLIAAILERHMGLPLAQRDLFFNVSGGLRLVEPAVDLAAAAAIWSSLDEAPIAEHCLLVGELALTGEIRRVSQLEVRLQEAKKLGFKKVLLPAHSPKKILEAKWGMELVGIRHIRELPKLLKA